jgi:8-oxo-dGTP diphosphatase
VTENGVTGVTENGPVSRSGPARVVVGAAIVRDGRLLAQRRATPAELAGRWELPGGRVERGESESAALRRECREELGALITVLDRLGGDVPLPGSSGSVLRIYAATVSNGSPEPRAVEHAGLRWVSGAELPQLNWLDADRILLPELARLLR